MVVFLKGAAVWNEEKWACFSHGKFIDIDLVEQLTNTFRFNEHSEKPYLNEEKLNGLVSLTGLTKTQIRNW